MSKNRKALQAASKRERPRGDVSEYPDRFRSIDGFCGHPRRRSGLHPADPEAELPQRVREADTRRLPPAPRGLPLGPDMNESPQKRPARHDGRLATDFLAALEPKTRQGPVRNDETSRRPLPQLEIRPCPETPTDLHRVSRFVRLTTRTLYGRPAGGVEYLEMNPRPIRRPAHEPPEGVDLPHRLSLRQPSDRGVAAHPRNRPEIPGQKKRPTAHPRGSPGRLGPGVPPAHHHHVPVRPHFPTQNVEKIRSRSSSVAVSPVISPSPASASRTAPAAISAGTSGPMPASAVAALLRASA